MRKKHTPAFILPLTWTKFVYQKRTFRCSLPICGIMGWVMQVDNKKEFPKRKRNRLENYDYSSCGAYFITVCTLEKQNCFWKNVGAIIDRPQDVELSTYGKMVDQAIQNIPSAYPACRLKAMCSCRIIFTFYYEFALMNTGDHWSPLQCHGL